MLDARPKKMMNMYILDILKRNTDSKHPMEMCKLDLENALKLYEDQKISLLFGRK